MRSRSQHTHACGGRSEVPITFGQDDYPNHMPILGRFLVFVSLIIGLPCLSRVIMDVTSGLNILYADTLE